MESTFGGSSLRINEQALRPAVIWQYTSFGSQSKSGSEFVERMLTDATLKAQNRSILEFFSILLRCSVRDSRPFATSTIPVDNT